MNLLEATIATAVMILAVSLIRFVGKKYISKTAVICLWNLVLLRAVLPLQMLAGKIPVVKRTYDNLQTSRTIVKLPDRLPVISSLKEIPLETVEQGEAFHSRMLPINPVWAIWLAGLFCFVLYFLIIYRREYRQLKNSVPTRNETAERLIRQMTFRRKIDLYKGEEFKTPVTYGVFRARIVLPAQLTEISRVDMRNMIAHELMHIRRHDVAKKYLLTAVLCLHWFNPMVWIMYRLYQKDQEISCDEQVLKTMGERQKKNYIYTMIKMAAGGKRFLTTTGFGSKHAGKERILEAMNSKKMGKRSVALSFPLGICFLLPLAFIRIPIGEAAQTKVAQMTQKEEPARQSRNPEYVRNSSAQLAPVFEHTYPVDALFVYDEEDFDYYAVYNDIVENYNDSSQELTEVQAKAIVVKMNIKVAQLAKENLERGIVLEPSDIWLIDEYYNFEQKHPNPYAE